MVRGRVRQLVDWGAAIKAGIIAGLVFLLVNLFCTQFVIKGATPMLMTRYFGSVLLGDQAFAHMNSPAQPPVVLPKGFEAKLPEEIAEFLHKPSPQEWRIYASMLLTHFALALLATFLIALIVHRGGALQGLILGAVLGACMYVINMYTFTKFMPSMFALNHWFFLLSHILFGALAGLLYEIFELEVFVDDRGQVVDSSSSQHA